MPAKTRHCGHCGARVQSTDTHCMDCGRELLPSTPPQAEAAPPSPPQPTIEMSQQPLPLPPSVEAEAAVEVLENWGHAIAAVGAAVGAFCIVAAFVTAVGGQYAIAIGLAAGGASYILIGAWLQAIHNVAAAAADMLGRQTEALEALARRTQ